MTQETNAPERLALVVEDVPAHVVLLRAAFRKLGDSWTVRDCGTAAEARLALAEGGTPPDVVVVDLGLPDGSGVELVRTARARFPETPIVVVSVASDEDNVLSSLRAGANGYVHKGEPVDALAESLAHALRGESPISPSVAGYLVQLATGPRSTPSHDPFRLSPRELELLRLISGGASYGDAARAMGVTLATVQTHIRSLYAKLGVNSKVRAINRGRDSGLV